MTRNWLSPLLVIFMLGIPAFPQVARPSDDTQEPPEFTMFAHVRDAVTGNPVHWAMVSLRTRVGATVRTVGTDSNGLAEIDRIQVGAYFIEIRHDSYQDFTSEEIVLVEGRLLLQRYEFVLQPVEAARAEPAIPKDPAVSVSEFTVPEKAQQEFRKGLEAFDQGELDQSIEHFDQATKIFPKFDDAYNQWALAFLFLGQPDSAEEILKRALGENEGNSRAHALLGIALRNKEELEASAESLRRAVELEPTDALSHLELARTLLALEDSAQALIHAERSHALDLGPADVHLVLFEALIKERQYEAALSELEEFVERYPDETRIDQVKAQKLQLEEFLKREE